MRIHRVAVSSLMLCLTLGAVALIGSGCAGTAYHRSTGAYVDDKGITTRVKTALFRDPLVSGFDVHVNTFRGDVQLSGFVDSEQQKERAAQIAREVSGVRSVTDNLEVKPAAMGAPAGSVSGSSGRITQPVPEQPAADMQPNNSAPAGAPPPAPPPQTGNYQNLQTGNNPPQFGNNHFEVNYANGQATLRGTVNSQTEKQDIERQVRQMPGVQTVDNQLQVQSPQ